MNANIYEDLIQLMKAIGVSEFRCDFEEIVREMRLLEMNLLEEIRELECEDALNAINAKARNKGS